MKVKDVVKIAKELGLKITGWGPTYGNVYIANPEGGNPISVETGTDHESVRRALMQARLPSSAPVLCQ